MNMMLDTRMVAHGDLDQCSTSTGLSFDFSRHRFLSYGTVYEITREGAYLEAWRIVREEPGYLLQVAEHRFLKPGDRVVFQGNLCIDDQNRAQPSFGHASQDGEGYFIGIGIFPWFPACGTQDTARHYLKKTSKFQETHHD